MIKILTSQIKLINNLVNHNTFHNIITVVILLQAVVLALETFSEFKSYISLFEYLNTLVLTIFIIEAILKIVALYPQPYNYFKDG